MSKLTEMNLVENGIKTPSSAIAPIMNVNKKDHYEQRSNVYNGCR